MDRRHPIEKPRSLTPQIYAAGIDHLAKADPDLGAIVTAFGPPPLWTLPPGFATLVRIVLEQQVSLASARTAFERLHQSIGEVTPGAFLTLDAQSLREIGFSRQKTRYCGLLAQALLDGELDLDRIGSLDDEAARSALTRMTGIGRWTADIYLLRALGRPDILPIGDLALVKAAREVKGVEQALTQPALEKLGEQWRPWRSVAARILWHHYLGGSSP